jgi:hypothetical protein
MLKLIKKEGTTGGVLGYDEIQILGARPWALAKPNTEKYGPWCEREVRCLYLAVTDDKTLTSFTGGDIEASLQDYDCFLGDTPIEMDMDGMGLFFA